MYDKYCQNCENTFHTSLIHIKWYLAYLFIKWSKMKWVIYLLYTTYIISHRRKITLPKYQKKKKKKKKTTHKKKTPTQKQQPTKCYLKKTPKPNRHHHHKQHLSNPLNIKTEYMKLDNFGPNGAVAMSSDNGLVGTGFASRYRPQGHYTLFSLSH